MLDPFTGSGSTLVAVTPAGRRYLGVDLEEKYCRLARRRLDGVERHIHDTPQRQTLKLPNGKLVPKL